MYLRSMSQIAAALAVLAGSLILVGEGASWALAPAVLALMAMFVIGLRAPWPWQRH
jgi:hypothetical protein